MAGVLAEKSIIVTGADSGIGAAAAQLFATAGARLVLASRNAERGTALAKKLVEQGAAARFIRTDVSVEDDVRAMVAAALESYGRLDGAFNNAGVGYAAKRVHELDREDWQRTIDINLTGVFLCMKHEIAAMLKAGGGAIVNTGSVGSVSAFPVAPEYNASKYGLLGLTRNVALDYGKDQIRVNALLPGATDTPLVVQQAKLKGPEHAMPHPMSVLGRMASPDEVAQGALWLLSDMASYVTGIALTVDGGFTLT
jgi:2,5-dichloro-2,5-cyclohexadiene-1,4-diol dehydrogenase 1